MRCAVTHDPPQSWGRVCRLLGHHPQRSSLLVKDFDTISEPLILITPGSRCRCGIDMLGTSRVADCLARRQALELLSPPLDAASLALSLRQHDPSGIDGQVEDLDIFCPRLARPSRACCHVPAGCQRSVDIPVRVRDRQGQMARENRPVQAWLSRAWLRLGPWPMP